MTGLKKLRKIVQDRLAEHLKKHGYIPCRYTPALWKNNTQLISFTLVVEDFSAKYVGKQQSHHLIDVLRSLYKITVNWAGRKYLDITLICNYEQVWVDISMPNYVLKDMNEF